MEVTVIIKLPDGTTKTVELVEANFNTSWGIPPLDPSAPKYAVGMFSLNGKVKDSSAGNSI